jgi:protocatechuate 3,4-dioxygenase beta subunit
MSITTDRRLRRREALAAFGGLGVAAAAGPAALAHLLGAQPATAAACILSPEVTEGPYWIANHLTRRDITDGRPGIPLALRLTVVDASSCSPIKGADVEIWHADARGVYSGFGSSSSSQRFLRGHQVTDAAGRVRFDTIWPGWYRGRTPHVHLKVHVGGNVVHTGQVFFDEKTTARVYRQAPYSSHGQPDTSHAEDGIFAQAGRSRAVLKLAGRGAGKRGYRGTITLGVAT